MRGGKRDMKSGHEMGKRKEEGKEKGTTTGWREEGDLFHYDIRSCLLSSMMWIGK